MIYMEGENRKLCKADRKAIDIEYVFGKDDPAEFEHEEIEEAGRLGVKWLFFTLPQEPVFGGHKSKRSFR